MSSSVEFDIETHVLQRYTGEARIQRLITAAYLDPELKEAALSLALVDVKQQRNVLRFREIYRVASTGTTGVCNLPAMDKDKWIAEAEDQNRLDRESLKAKLNTAQAHLNKEAIRSAFTALSENLCTTGEMQEAFHAEMRAKDHCTTLQQTANHTTQSLALAIYARNYETIPGMVFSLERSQRQSAESHMAMALARLSQGSYEAAGDSFRAAAMSEFPPSEVSTKWESAVLCPEDNAMYAAVLTLVARRDNAIALAEHPSALETAPILREILLHFHKHANYHEASRLLESHVWPLLRHDPYFQATSAPTGKTHMTEILETIRTKAIVEFWKPYSSCPLVSMQESLGETITGTIEELKTTILDLLRNRLPSNTRFDMRTNTLVRDRVDQTPRESVSRNLQTSQMRALDDTYSMMIRVACIDNESRFGDQKKRRQAWANRNDPSATNDDVDDAMVVDTDAMNPEDLY